MKYKVMIISEDDCSLGYWVVVKGSEFYRGTIYTAMKDAAILNATQLKQLEAQTPAGYQLQTVEV